MNRQLGQYNIWSQLIKPATIQILIHLHNQCFQSKCANLKIFSIEDDFKDFQSPDCYFRNCFIKTEENLTKAILAIIYFIEKKVYFCFFSTYSLKTCPINNELYLFQAFCKQICAQRQSFSKIRIFQIRYMQEKTLFLMIRSSINRKHNYRYLKQREITFLFIYIFHIIGAAYIFLNPKRLLWPESELLGKVCLWLFEPKKMKAGTKLSVHVWRFQLLFKMLAVPLKTAKSLDLSKSSFMDGETDIKKLKDQLENEKRAVRKLILKVKKLQQTLSKEREQGGSSKTRIEEWNQNEQLLKILKTQIEKARQSEQLLKIMLSRINILINQLSLEGLVYENPQHKFYNRTPEQSRHHYCSTATSLSPLKRQEVQLLPNHESALKQLAVLQSYVKVLSENYKAVRCENQQLCDKKQLQQVQAELRKEKQCRAEIQRQLQAERRTRLKLKRLLEKSQCEKNVLMRKIDKIAVQEIDLSIKKREEWMHLSKSLTLKISDLQKQKRQIYSQCMREKESWNKKYGELLKIVRSLQLTKR